MISFKNESLANYLMFKLDKLENEFSIEELNTIDEVMLDASLGDVDLKEIMVLNHLSSILILNMFLSNDDISLLLSINSLKNIYFEKCFFEDSRLINHFEVEELSLVNCDIYDYDFLYDMINLKKLSVIHGEISLAKINSLEKLNYLQLSYSNINDIEYLDLPILAELYIDNTNIFDLSILDNLSVLKILSLSEDQYLKNEKMIDVFERRKVLILNESFSTFDRGVLND